MARVPRARPPKQPPVPKPHDEKEQAGPQESRVGTPEAPRFKRTYLGALERQKVRTWLDSAVSKADYAERLLSTAIKAARSEENPYAREILINRLGTFVEGRAWPVALRRDAEMLLRILASRRAISSVSGRKPSAVEDPERKRLMLDTHERVRGILPRSHSERDSSTRGALLKGFKGDGDEGVPALWLLQKWSPARVARSILAARVELRERKRRGPAPRKPGSTPPPSKESNI
jgi:hypothetical protein